MSNFKAQEGQDPPSDAHVHGWSRSSVFLRLFLSAFCLKNVNLSWRRWSCVKERQACQVWKVKVIVIGECEQRNLITISLNLHFLRPPSPRERFSSFAAALCGAKRSLFAGAKRGQLSTLWRSSDCVYESGELMLDDISKYRFISHGMQTLPGTKDPDIFQETLHAMEIMGISHGDVKGQ